MDLSKNSSFLTEKGINYIARSKKRKKMPVCKIKSEFLILSIHSGAISNFINFDSNTAVSFNASCFSNSKSVNNLKILFSRFNK